MIEVVGNKIYLEDNYEIRGYYTQNGIVRALVYNECIQSLLYVDKEKRKELGLNYFNYYNIPIDLNPNVTNCLMLGGGAISYPHYYLNKYKEKRMDIVEINPKCIEYAKKYFYLDELIEDAKGRVNIILDDAIKYISYTNKKYDYILIDLFNGRNPIKEIYSEDNILNLKKILSNNGVIVINYIICNESFKEELKQIIKITSNYKIISNTEYFDETYNFGNIIIILSNNEITIPNNYEYKNIDIMFAQ